MADEAVAEGVVGKVYVIVSGVVADEDVGEADVAKSVCDVVEDVSASAEVDAAEASGFLA